MEKKIEIPAHVAAYWSAEDPQPPSPWWAFGFVGVFGFSFWGWPLLTLLDRRAPEIFWPVTIAGTALLFAVSYGLAWATQPARERAYAEACARTIARIESRIAAQRQREAEIRLEKLQAARTQATRRAHAVRAGFDPYVRAPSLGTVAAVGAAVAISCDDDD